MKFNVWGLSGTLATQYERDLSFAEERLWHWIDAIDAACNRFKADSEISRMNRRADDTVSISPTMELALDAALRAGAATDGLCDPTVLSSLLALGYDRDYDELAAHGAVEIGAPAPSPGLGAIDLDVAHHQVTLAPGCFLDLGASAKALTADLVARDVVARGGVVVEIGGDVAVEGVGPEGPWAIGVATSLDITGREPRITIASGGIATSSSTTRVWRAGGRVVNHIIDPRTGACAQGVYASATVSAENCVVANAFATAALLWGEDAGYHISQAGWSGRLVRHDGTVDFVGAWPREEYDA
jgi:FAD:protein FMN transferase